MKKYRLVTAVLAFTVLLIPAAFAAGRKLWRSVGTLSGMPPARTVITRSKEVMLMRAQPITPRRPESMIRLDM